MATSQKNQKVQIFDPSKASPTQNSPLFFSKAQPVQQSVVNQKSKPQRINTFYQFLPENTPKIQCHYHYDQFITMFCRSPTCFMPLCPQVDNKILKSNTIQCIKIHSQEHQSYNTYGQFDTLENSLTEIYQKVSNYCNQFSDEINQITTLTGNAGDGFGKLNQEQMDKLKQTRQQAHQMVDAFFNQLEQEVITEIDKNKEFIQTQSHQFEIYLNRRWSQLIQFLEKLNTDKAIKNLVKFHQSNMDQDNQLYFKESKHFVKQLSQCIPEVVVDQSGLYQLNMDLARFVTLKQTSHLANQQFYSQESQQKQYQSTPQMKQVQQQSQGQPQYYHHEFPQFVNQPQFQNQGQIQSLSQYEPPQKQYAREGQMHPYLRTPPKV